MEMTFTLQEIHTIAKKCWEQANGKKTLAFHGQMGTGKTTLIRALCDVIGVTDTVGSPTFSIINEYASEEGMIFHIDLYRLKDLAEIIQAGVEDCLYSGNICLVEWPEIAASILPEDTVHFYLDVIDEETRHLCIGDN
jgi:tRNA threonylcarbamoyladenosine biosynthesis protein TsaE